MQQEIRRAQQGEEAADLHIREILEMGLISAAEQLQVTRPSLELACFWSWHSPLDQHPPKGFEVQRG